MTLRLTAILLASLVGSSSAAAGQKRVAILVAHPLGGPNLVPLRYTGNDLERMREVLRTVGDFKRHDILVSFGESVDDVTGLFDEATRRIANASAGDEGDDTLFIFYYSGHAKDGELRLGDTRLSLVDLKKLVEATNATVRVALLDSCRSGSITRLKGAAKGAPITMAIDDATEQMGQVFITASSENEDAQESDDIQGSFFTYFLTTGMRGAADNNDDGNITLSEAYAFAYANTVSRTVGTRGGTQHPMYRFDLRGTGDVVLTRPGQPTSAIVFAQALAGHFVIFDLGRRVVVAEFDKQSGRPARLAVAPGRYVVKKRETDHLKMQKLRVNRRSESYVNLDEMETVAFEDDYAKGAVITVDQVLYGKLGLRFSVGFGGQVFLSTPARDAYFPSIGLVQLSLDIDNALRRHLGVRFDVGLGGSGRRALVIEDAYLGDLRYDVEVGQLSLGAAVTGSWALHERIQIGGNARLGFITVSRKFIGVELPQQGFATLTPGLGFDASVLIFSWLHAGARVRLHYMFFNVDESMSLAYVDGSLVLTAVMR